MSNFIAQSSFSVATVSIADLLLMPTATNGEQFDVSQAKVDKLYDLLMKDGVLLQQPIEVTIWNEQRYLTGGRHRRAALAMAYEHDSLVNVLVYEADSAEEVADRIITSNGSRSCTATEQKYLRTAAKNGFGTINVESVMTLLFDVDGTPTGLSGVSAKAKVISLVAMSITDRVDTDMKPNVAEAVARSIVSRINNMRRTIEVERDIEPSYDKAGNEVGGGVVVTRNVSNLLAESLTNPHKMTALLDSVVGVIKCATSHPITVPVGIMDAARKHKDGSSCVRTAEIVTEGADTLYASTVGFADNVSRGASTYAALVSLAVRDELTSLFECIDADAELDEYDELD